MVVGRQHNHRDHDQALTTLLETARKCNIRLNYDKLQYKQEEVDFFGETNTTNGCKPAQSKVKAVNGMPAPTCKKQVQSFIGMINYLSKFSARFSELAEPIRELCKDKVPFNWGPEHQDAFKLMKREIVTAPILAYYKPKKANCLANWCKHQGSRSMPTTGPKTSVFCKQSTDWRPERVCCNRIRVLGCGMGNGKDFPHFLYASHFILKTDQKSLETILSKSINQATTRLQCIYIGTFPYHFMVRYIPWLTKPAC